MTNPMLLATMTIILFLLTPFALPQSSPTRLAPRFQVTDVSRFDGIGPGTIGINDQGEVAFPLKTQVLHHWDVRHHVFLWRNGIRRDIGILSQDKEDAGFPAAVSDRGQVLSVTEFDGISYLWNRGQLSKLGKFTAHAFNDQGVVVGEAGEDPLNSHAVVWGNGEIHVLPGLPDRPQAKAASVNDKNQIVGSAEALDYDKYESVQKKRPDLYHDISGALNENIYITLAHACLWQNGIVTELPMPPGMAQTSAIGINNKGQILGSATTASDINSQTEAVLWDGKRITILGSLGGLPTWANALNDNGQVVGIGFLKGSQSYGGVRAFLWGSGKIYNLNTLIPKDSGWILQDATGVNNRGQIVGYGQFRSASGLYKMHIFLLTPR